MIIDSHCHLNYEPLSNDLEKVIERALSQNIKLLLTISTNDISFDFIKDIIKKYSFIFGTYGIHPHETKLYKDLTSEMILNKISKNRKIIGIGETGLDYYYEHSDKIVQKKLFLEHIKSAQILNLPAIIHTRDAENDTFEILKSELKNANFKVLIHCFTGSKEFAYKLLDLGCYISASGVVTFKKSVSLAETFKNLPLDRLLVETDSPYLTPTPLRGKSNEPSYIIHTINFLAKLRNIPSTKISQETTKNFFNLFGNVL